jgi:transmembrane sensor
MGHMEDENLAKRLHELEEKWFNKTITPDEAREYAEWYNADQDKPVEIPAGLAKSDDELEKKIWKNIQGRTGSAPVKNIRRDNTYVAWAAAASVIFLLGIAGFYFNKNKKNISVETVAHPIKNEVLPGSNKAYLTLANGTKVLLDSASNGLLSVQGNAKVVKLANGQLAYTTADETATEIVLNTLSTPRGGMYNITLSDGTQVWLNAESSITYPTAFIGNERTVKITGEAYFEVAKDKAHPFKVDINGRGFVEVLGTHFNISSYDDEPAVKTTLLEGSVRVANATSNSVIEPGEQASFKKTEKITLSKNIDLDEVMAWKDGYFLFNDATVETIMRQIARWYDAEIVYEGNVRQERFAGKVSRASNALKLIEAMELTKTIKMVIEGRKITVMPYRK